MINELFSKRPANLEEILDSDANPTQEQILQSKDFQVSLINDLINNKRNVASWEVYEKSGLMEDIDDESEDSFNIDYTFNFKYSYKETLIPLTIFINGKVDVDWVGRNISATYLQPPEYKQPEIDEKNLGRMLDLALFDDDGSEISLTWLTLDLETKVAKSIISPYL